LVTLLFTGITAVSAQIAIPLGFTPVPITLQVFGVLLSGLALGSRWGAISQMQYLALGALGFPVFAGLSGGPAAFFGASAGYLIGFVPGAFIAGWAFERMGAKSRFGAWVAGIAGVCVIYLCGASWLAVWLSMFSSKDLTLRAVWALGIAPFIGVDLLKAIAASGLAIGGRAGRGLIRSFGTLDR
jgi:biotin transport system substrate-specific component